MDLPGAPDEVDSVRDLWHERFSEAEAPVAVFEVGDCSDGIAACVGSIVPGAVVVHGPVRELKVGIGAH